MNSRLLTQVLGAALVSTWATVIAPAPGAIAEPLSDAAAPPACPDVDLVFARGTGEPVGLGYMGEAFENSLRSKLGTKSLGVYAVQYPATIDFPRAVDGINDAAAHIQATAANCPKTKIVLSGYSQGAAVAGFTTADVVPPGAADSGVTGPMPASVADHVAAVALFGKPDAAFMDFINQPAVTIGPLYAGKTLESCVPGDPICSGGGDYGLHNQYVADGRVDQAADFVVGRLGLPAPVAPPSPEAPGPVAPAPPAPGAA
ncbi:cutinase family protein [Mycobacterium antarcticum]|uniref:cutinase family protein n=1 Tax=unclassified Mycolicibacterium TaxID=2636767 RepID=UPI0023905ACF|nr:MULTISPECIES: cutinase family protein [unclassified Mycolicibacterium]GLP81238.1 cutinase [Mycolicibacterium sp. TUM20984]